MFKKIMPEETRLRMFIGTVVLFSATSLFAQGPDALWTKTYGCTEWDEGYSVQQTTDGGYIIAGSTTSYGANDDDVYLIKTDSVGDTLWTRTYGDTDYDYGESVQQTTDGGYIIAGFTSSWNGGNWKSNVYLIKTDALGDTLWTKIYGGTSDDMGYSVQQTTDGGYIIAGFTSSYGAGDYDVYLIKTDSVGDTLWTKTYGGTDYDYGKSVQQTTDGGYIIAGATSSYGAGSNDVYLIKTDSLGDTLWTKTYGGTNSDGSNSVQQTTDGGYIIAGRTDSYGAGLSDVYLIKTDSLGDTLWTKTYGGTNSDESNSVQQTTDGGYIIAGETYSYGAGDEDIYLIKTNPLKLISPDGAENWAGGSNHSIIWRYEGSTVADHYRLLYSTDGGSNYPDTIAKTVANTDTSYLWTLPSVNSATCRVDVQILDSLDNVISDDASDSNFTIDSDPPSPVTLISPSDNAYLNDSTVNFIWNKASDNLSGIDHYVLQYALDSSFTQGLVETTAVDTVFTTVLSDTIYYWHIKAIDKAGNEGAFSISWQFEVDTKAPSTPVLISPIGGVYEKDTLITFQWNTVKFGREETIGYTFPVKKGQNKEGIRNLPGVLSSEVRYILQVDTTSGFTSPIIVDTLSVNLDTVSLYENSPFYWRVKAYDLAGNQGNFSNPDSFGIDMSSPILDSTSIWTDTSYIGGFEITIKVIDNLSGVDSVLLYYKREEDTDWIIKTMQTSGNWFTDTIPAVSNADDTVKYYIEAVDNVSNTSIDPAGAPSSYYSFVANYTGIQEKSTKPHNFSFEIKNTLSIGKVIFNLVLPRADDITLCIYDITGRLIDMPINGRKQAGIYRISWTSGKSAGVYFYSFNSSWEKKAGKFIFMK